MTERGQYAPEQSQHRRRAGPNATRVPGQIPQFAARGQRPASHAKLAAGVCQMDGTRPGDDIQRDGQETARDGQTQTGVAVATPNRRVARRDGQETARVTKNESASA